MCAVTASSEKTVPDYTHKFLDFSFTTANSRLGTVVVTVPAQTLNKCFEYVAENYCDIVSAPGFFRGQVSLEYIKKNYNDSILHYLKEFLFKYAVMDVLYQSIRDQKIMVAGEPRLVRISMPTCDQDAQYIFELSLFPGLTIYDWKYLPFKPPKRKNYKDLDRQVQSFIEEEKARASECKSALGTGDWVHFTIDLVHKDGRPVFDAFTQTFWFNLGDEEIESSLKQLFLGREVGDVFITQNDGLQAYLSDEMASKLWYQISIIDAVKYERVCFDELKRHFRIKTNKDMHKKLIEVFSYRNDMSQRRAMVEEGLELMMSHNRIAVAPQLLLRQKAELLEMIRENPDYNVYRKHKDFELHIEQLAEKQVREAILIDKVAYQENITVTDQDAKGYLNLTKRPRLKEFIYFTLSSTKLGGHEVPVATHVLKRTCLREKTINHILYHLTKK